MDYTEEQKTGFRSEFKKRRTRQFAAAAPIILAMLGVALVADNEQAEVAGIPTTVLAPLLFVVVAGGLVFSLYNWRCPACNRYLGRAMSPKFCTKCGVALQ